MVHRSLLLLAVTAAASAQTYTLTGCHAHGNVEYCYLPDGTETPWTTYAPSATASAIATQAASSTISTASTVPTVATYCHAHGDAQFCMVGKEEWEVVAPVDLATAANEYSNCHTHGEAELHCSDGSTSVTLRPASDDITHESGVTVGNATSEADTDSAATEGVSCHDHAGVPHCVDAEGNTVQGSCARPERRYNVPLRIGLLFVILLTSGLGVLAPILIQRFTSFSQDHVVLVVIRCFSTGIIISTAIVHLFTHAELYFANECLGGLDYEATTGAILMAGLFLTFAIEYTAHRYSTRVAVPRSPASGDMKATEQPSDASSEEAQPDRDGAGENATLKTSIMEIGIIFHSILIGIVLVVAGDSGFITLFIVILFHQVFEGLALGSRLAGLPGGLIRKLLLALAFAVTTPIGMTIGLGVLSQFNGNDPGTLIAIGTLNALSAGILLWVGVVDMWVGEFYHGGLANAGVARTVLCVASLMAGMVVMSVLGKWA